MKTPNFFKQNIRFLIIVLLLTVTPFVSYLLNFHGKVSDDHAIWGTFGDFIGGTLNTILTFVLLIYTTWSFHKSQELTQIIHRETNKFSKEVHEESKSMQKSNVRPYPALLFFIVDSILTISIKNKGMGPLLIQKMLFKKGDEESNLLHKLIEKITYITHENNRYSTNSAINFILSPTEEILLFSINLANENPEFAKILIDDIAGIYTELEYTDIFGSKFEPVNRVIPNMND